MSEGQDFGGSCLKPSAMINVRNAWKTFDGKEYILRNLDMNVIKGQIYSLIGSSGAGKTTLLQCITGLVCLNSGEINVDINSCLQIGYMPQELALYSELTLLETFQFFGMILYMSNTEIKRRVTQLSQLLDLPPQHTQITELSGGQQRRISVAVAMLKNPQLLILDEPTASLDTVLKRSIWEYLTKLAKEQGKTILLTTHYIEEANNADKVGFMSNGRILLEGSPEEVKNSTQPHCERLEDVYYKLCTKQHREDETISAKPEITGTTMKPPVKCSNYSSRRVMAFSLKTIFYIRRNQLIFYVFILSPIFMCLLQTWALERPKGIKLGYMNFESNCTHEEINCSSSLSCRYLRKLGSNDYQMVNLGSVEEGKRAVEKNAVWGFVRFNWNFSEGVVNRLDYFYAAEHVEISEEDEARIWLDMSSYPIGNMVKKHFYDSFLESIEDWYRDCGWNTRAAHPLLRVEEPLFGKVDESLVSTGIPPVLVNLMFSISVMLGVLFVLTEKELGTLKRCRVNGLKTYELLISIFVTCFTCLIPTGIALLLLLYLFSGPSNGPVFWTSLLLYLQALTGILLGMLIGLCASRLTDALQVTMGFLYLITFLSGTLWPVEGLHWIAKILYIILPSTVPTGSLKTITNRGYHKSVYVGLSHSLVWIAAVIISIVITLRVLDKKL